MNYVSGFSRASFLGFFVAEWPRSSDQEMAGCQTGTGKEVTAWLLLWSAEYFAVIADWYIVSFECRRGFDRSGVFSVIGGMKFAVTAAPLKLSFLWEYLFSEWIVLSGYWTLSGECRFSYLRLLYRVFCLSATECGRFWCRNLVCDRVRSFLMLWLFE